MSSLHALTNPSEPLAPEHGPGNRVPLPLTSFIGRDDEADALFAMVTDPRRRLVTVTGPGGIGKTRLVIQVAHRYASAFRDPVVFLAFADVRNARLLPGTVAHALGVNEPVGETAIERIRDTWRDDRLLLVVDNLEHLLDAAPFFTELLAECPGITILATSRHRLQVAGEHVFDIRPLSIQHSVALFEERAQAIAPDFTVTAESRQDIVDICARLDGLPLAIELAAARVPVLPPSALHERLGNLMELLSDGPRDAPNRHRGMRQTIAWSHDLLNTDEQALFRALAVFEGGFTLDAVTAMTGDAADTLAGISALEASSLVRLRPEPRGTPRFRMLETVREFALERLRAHGEEQAARGAHAAYVTSLTEDTERIWWRSGGLDKLDELEPEIPNIRAALAWMRRTGDVPALLRLAGSLAPLWATRGYSTEGRAWLEWGLPRGDGTPPTILVVAVRALSWILNQHDEFYRSLVAAQYALELSNEIEDARNRVASLILSGIAGKRVGYIDESLAWLTTAVREMDRCTDEAWGPVTRCIVLNQLGALHIEQGAIDQAERWFEESLATQQSLGLRFTPGGHAIKGLGEVAHARGDPRRALGHYLTSMRYAREARDVRSIARCLGSIAATMAALGHHETAARLFGASEAHHESISYPFVMETFGLQRALGLPEPWASMHPECTVADGLRRSLWELTAHIRAVRLDPEQAETWWNEGRALDLDAALALIPPIETDAVQPQTDGHPGGLSPRELDVLRLLAQGHTDREIAERLFISPRTVQNHVQRMYARIGVASRSAATRWAMEHDIT